MAACLEPPHARLGPGADEAAHGPDEGVRTVGRARLSGRADAVEFVLERLQPREVAHPAPLVEERDGLGAGPFQRPFPSGFAAPAPPPSIEDAEVLEQTTLTINSFFGWDFNSCEALRQGDVWHPIDFANACPDSQVTSLHYHFPWLIKANLRWSLYCAATEREMRKNMDWAPFIKIADKDWDWRDKLKEYAKLAEKRFETEKFRKFCQKQLGALDELAYDFFGSDVLKDAVRQKVQALFPAHEHDEFTELFWSRIQDWRRQEGQAGDKDGF